MSSLIEHITKAGYGDRILTERQLARLLDGGDARRYGLVNRAIKNGTLIRIKRGLYTLSTPHQNQTIHPFLVAQALKPQSYISMETALAYHGWVPEAVYETASITPERKSNSVSHDIYGHFTFRPLAVQPYQFLRGVARIKIEGRVTLMASPLRGLLDLVAVRKEAWSGLSWIESGLRIDRAHLLTLRQKDFAAMKSVYKHSAMTAFVEEFASAIRQLKSGPQT